MIQISRLGHATLSTPDIAGQTEYYSHVLGLSVVARGKDSVVLASRHGLEAIELVRGEASALQRLALQLAPGSDLGDVAKTLTGLGLKPELRSDISPGITSALAFEDPKGTKIDLFNEYRFAPLGSPSAFNILKLGHVAYRVPDIETIVKFYCDVFGFKVSDWRGDRFVFLRCNTDHHTLNFFRADKPQLHHIAFEVPDWAEMKQVCDWLARNKVHLVWGPGRHIIGHNVATYHRNADMVRVEIFTEMDQMKDERLGYFDPRPWHQEFPLYPKVHGPETLRNYWGFGSEAVIKGYQTDELPVYGLQP